jgi:beta-glucosidase/6-phospho-beta-glucosidase/beta-galactosidase
MGYQSTFGLIAGDRKAQQRTVKPSAWWLDAVTQATNLSISQS